MNAWLPRDRSQWLALSVGVLALIACLLLGLAEAQQALLSYLFAFVFFTGLGAGSLALLMVHALTGGAWGLRLRPQLLAAARTLPLMALLLLPILIGLHILYPWARSDALAQDALLRAQSWYLDSTFFVIRSIVYFTLWLILLFAFQRRLDDPARLPRIAAPGLIVYALTTLLAATDWAMSLTPHWHSSTFGVMVATGWMLGAAALAVAGVAFTKAGADTPSALLQDLGSLLLMFVLAWSYLAFMQYLTIWIADLPAETVWYIPRTLTSWRMLAWLLIALHFAVPFAVLLSRRAKRSRAWLGCIAALLLTAQMADAFWLIVPGFRPHGFSLRWSDLFAPLGVGALWWCVYIGQLYTTRAAVKPSSSAQTAAHPQTEQAHG